MTEPVKLKLNPEEADLEIDGSGGDHEILEADKYLLNQNDIRDRQQ